MSLVKENDILFAYKALSIVGGLSANARRVAGAIIDHFNRRTGQCDPSVDRLATLLGVNRATVLRATAELCGTDNDGGPFFLRKSHGGKFHRASYSPNWSKFRSIVKAWEAKMEGRQSPRDDVSNVAEVRPCTSQKCDLNGRKTATQTNRRNQSKKPTVQVDGSADVPPDVPPEDKSQGLWRGRKPQEQRHFLLPFAGGKQPSHSQAAKAGAERRWYNELQQMDARLSVHIVDALGDRPDVYAGATEAEMRKRGDGLPYVLTALNDALRQAKYG